MEALFQKRFLKHFRIDFPKAVPLLIRYTDDQIPALIESEVSPKEFRMTLIESKADFKKRRIDGK